MSDSHYIRRVRTQLFYAQNGLCYWCRKPMRFVVRPDPNDTNPRTCTLDHRFERGHPERGQHPGKRISAITTAATCRTRRRRARSRSCARSPAARRRWATYARNSQPC